MKQIATVIILVDHANWQPHFQHLKADYIDVDDDDDDDDDDDNGDEDDDAAGDGDEEKWRVVMIWW